MTLEDQTKIRTLMEAKAALNDLVGILHIKSKEFHIRARQSGKASWADYAEAYDDIATILKTLTNKIEL